MSETLSEFLLARVAEDEAFALSAQAEVFALRFLAVPYADHPDFRAEWSVQ